MALVPSRCWTCSKLCSLTPVTPASAEAIFLAASTFPSAQRSALMGSLCSVLQQESSKTTEGVSSWSLVTPWRVLLWYGVTHTHTHTQHTWVYKHFLDIKMVYCNTVYIYIPKMCIGCIMLSVSLCNWGCVFDMLLFVISWEDRLAPLLFESALEI